MNLTVSQSSIIEALPQTKEEGFTFTAKGLCALDPRLRHNATAAYLQSQLKKGRLEVVSKHGATYDWRLPREFFEIPHKICKTAKPGGNGAHPGQRKLQGIPQLKPGRGARKVPQEAPAVPPVTTALPEKLLALALRAERGEPVTEDLIELALSSLRMLK